MKVAAILCLLVVILNRIDDDKIDSYLLGPIEIEMRNKQWMTINEEYFKEQVERAYQEYLQSNACAINDTTLEALEKMIQEKKDYELLQNLVAMGFCPLKKSEEERFCEEISNTTAEFQFPSDLLTLEETPDEETTEEQTTDEPLPIQIQEAPEIFIVKLVALLILLVVSLSFTMKVNDLLISLSSPVVSLTMNVADLLIFPVVSLTLRVTDLLFVPVISITIVAADFLFIPAVTLVIKATVLILLLVGCITMRLAAYVIHLVFSITMIVSALLIFLLFSLITLGASVPFILVGCIIMKVAKFLNTENTDQPTTSSHLKPVLDSKLEGITELRCRIASRIVKAAQTTADGKEILTPRSP